ncbi:MAG: lipopolysaccharide biosynthesis protein, partial [Cyclobacteriaceae bacterium]
MLGMEYVGVFTITFFMGNIIDIPRRIVSQVASPIIAKNWATDNVSEIDIVYKKSALNLLIFGTLLFLGIWLNVDFIFNVIPNANIYVQGKYVILFISLAKLVDMSFGPSTEIINYSRYFKFNLFLSIILSGLLIISNLIFIPIFGINGAAFATLMSMIIFNLVKYIFLRKKYSLSPFTREYLIVIVITLLTLLILQFVHFSNIWLEMLFKSIFILIIHTGSIYFLRISEEVNNIVNKVFNYLFNRNIR